MYFILFFKYHLQGNINILPNLFILIVFFSEVNVINIILFGIILSLIGTRIYIICQRKPKYLYHECPIVS